MRRADRLFLIAQVLRPGNVVTAAHLARKLALDYTDGQAEDSVRVVRPLALYYWGSAWTLVAWCELRSDFRTFRPDRMRAVRVLDEPIPTEPGTDLEAFLARMATSESD